MFIYISVNRVIDFENVLKLKCTMYCNFNLKSHRLTKLKLFSNTY